MLGAFGVGNKNLDEEKAINFSVCNYLVVKNYFYKH